MSIEVHMFWAYGNISNLEKICINSFMHQGYTVNLWTYGDISNAPAGTKIRDGREIVPESRVYFWRNKSYACFSDLFRYAVLRRLGGLYADTDVIALIPSGELPKKSFLVSERTDTSIRAMVRSFAGLLLGAKRPRINNNLIFCAEPKPGDIIDLAHAISDRFPVEKMEWGDIGPNLISILANEYPEVSYEIKDPDFANPVDWWDCPTKLLEPNLAIPATAAFLHCYSGRWGIAGVDRNSTFPKGSLMATFGERYL